MAPEFAPPTFESWKLCYTAIGATVFWGKWGRTNLRAYILSDIVAALPVGYRLQHVIEFSLFIALGTLVAIGVTNPTNAAQALVAGFGWTGFFSSATPAVNSEERQPQT